VAHLFQQYFIAPRRLRHQMVERLAHRLDVVRIQAGGHGLNALALAG
jgi:hypothetical protein